MASMSYFDTSRLQSIYNDNQNAILAAAGAVTAGYGLFFLYKAIFSGGIQGTRTALSLGAGKLKDVDSRIGNYNSSFTNGVVQDNEKVTDMVDDFYNFVTDTYEWGWGQSFHFAPGAPGLNWHSSELVHQARIGAILNLHEGVRCLDCGCGIGGPMRAIAKMTGATITGVTINGYQVQRSNYLIEKSGLSKYCKTVQGNFMDLSQFPDNSFDCAFAIEATCHADKLEKVYGEIFRVLKPGGKFLSYEWVTTKHYDSNNPQHVDIIQEINYGNGLPNMRTYKEAEEAGKTVGFDLLTSRRLDLDTPGAKFWWQRLDELWPVIRLNRIVVACLRFLRLLPAGMNAIQTLLVGTVQPLIDSGKLDIFTPLHLLVFQKPEN